MRRAQAIPAVLALCGLLLPWVRVSGLSLHLADAHHEPADDPHTDEMEDAFHGHHHEEGEPGHQHSLIGCDLVAHRARFNESAGSLAGHHAVAFPPILSTARAVTRARGSVSNDHGPPGERASRSILRI